MTGDGCRGPGKVRKGSGVTLVGMVEVGLWGRDTFGGKENDADRVPYVGETFLLSLPSPPPEGLGSGEEESRRVLWGWSKRSLCPDGTTEDTGV